MKGLIVTMLFSFLAGYAVAQDNWKGAFACALGLIAVGYIMGLEREEQ